MCNKDCQNIQLLPSIHNQTNLQSITQSTYKYNLHPKKQYPKLLQKKTGLQDYIKNANVHYKM